MTTERRLAAAAVLAALCGSLLWSSHRIRSTTSVTFDETFYLNGGLQTVHDGRLDTRLVAEGVAPLPILLTYVPSLLFQPREARPDVWRGTVRDAGLIGGPRALNTWLVGLPLVIAGFVWLYRRHGVIVAASGAAVIVLSPTITAHAALATTDLSIALFGLLAIFATGAYLRHPSAARLIVLAVAVGAALSAKYSGVFLLPVVGLMLLTVGRPRWAVGRSVLLLLLVLTLWWGLHLFAVTGPLKSVPFAETRDDSPWVQVLGRGATAEWVMDQAHRTLKRPAPIEGVLFRWLHNADGHTAFLMGERSAAGWWHYFPATFAFKSTPAELALAFVLVGFVGVALVSPLRAWREADFDRRAMALSAVALLALVLTAHVNIGHRHLIILYPLVILAAFDRLGASLAGRRHVLGGLCTALAVAQLVSHLAIGPHALAYFNRFAGGPENGWRLLVDSNLDWGQDLPALRAEIARLRGRQVALQYFGTAVPAAYGVAADPVTELRSPAGDYDLLAVSATMLQGLYVGAGDPYRAFREMTADGRAGYSIRLYRLDTPERRLAFQQVAGEMAGRDEAWRQWSRPQ